MTPAKEKEERQKKKAAEARRQAKEREKKKAQQLWRALEARSITRLQNAWRRIKARKRVAEREAELPPGFREKVRKEFAAERAAKAELERKLQEQRRREEAAAKQRQLALERVAAERARAVAAMEAAGSSLVRHVSASLTVVSPRDSFIGRGRGEGAIVRLALAVRAPASNMLAEALEEVTDAEQASAEVEAAADLGDDADEGAAPAYAEELTPAPADA